MRGTALPNRRKRSAAETPSPPASRSAASPSRGSWASDRSEEHTSELQSLTNLVCRLLLEISKAHDKRPALVLVEMADPAGPTTRVLARVDDRPLGAVGAAIFTQPLNDVQHRPGPAQPQVRLRAHLHARADPDIPSPRPADPAVPGGLLEGDPPLVCHDSHAHQDPKSYPTPRFASLFEIVRGQPRSPLLPRPPSSA